MHEFLPAHLREILKSHAAIVQKPLAQMSGFAMGPGRPQETRYCFDDLASPVFTFSDGLFRLLALRQIDHESNALVPVLVKARQADEYRNSATVFSVILLLERWDDSPRLQLPQGPFVTIAPFRRCQAFAMHQTESEIRAIIADHPKKCVIRFDNATVHLPYENPDYVSIHEAPNLRFAFCKIAIGLRERQ